MNKSLPELRGMIDKAHDSLSISCQCSLLGIYKSGVYYQPRGESELNLTLIKLIDEQYLKHPHMGVPSMTTWLRKDKGYLVNSKRIERLYKLMDLQSMAPDPHTSRAVKEHKKYPYLLRDLKIEKVNHVWATDITYIPIRQGFMYLMAVIDLKSRYIVGWSISNTMDAQWCRETMEDCINRHGCPQIVNTDQGSQFTSDEFTGLLIDNDIQISMDGKGRATDNIFIERFWRSLKYEDIYLRAYQDGQSLFLGLIEYMNYYSTERRHSSIEDQRPIQVYESIQIEQKQECEPEKSKHRAPSWSMLHDGARGNIQFIEYFLGLV